MLKSLRLRRKPAGPSSSSSLSKQLLPRPASRGQGFKQGSARSTRLSPGGAFFAKFQSQQRSFVAGGRACIATGKTAEGEAEPSGGKGVENAPIPSAATTASSPPLGGQGRNGGRGGGASQGPRSADLPGRPGSPPPARRRETVGGAEGSPSPAAAARRPPHRLRCGQTALAPAPPLSSRAAAEEGRRRTPRPGPGPEPGPRPGPGRRCKGAGAADLPSSAVSILSGGAVVTQPRGSPGRGRSLRGRTGRRGGRRERSRPGQVRVLRCGRGSDSQARAEGAGEADRAGRRGAGEGRGRGARPGRGAARKGRGDGGRHFRPRPCAPCVRVPVAGRLRRSMRAAGMQPTRRRDSGGPVGRRRAQPGLRCTPLGRLWKYAPTPPDPGAACL